MALHVWSSAKYTFPLPAGHRFPIAKYALLRERDLMSMFGDQPFVVLGINCDRTREELKRFVRANQINFPCIYDGPYGGAIAKEWNVQGRTARFILDHHGIIRYRHVNDAQLEEAVRELMKKAQATKDKKVKKT